MANLLTQLTNQEISLLISIIKPPLASIAAGDGSLTSVAGQGLALEASLLSNSTLFQKVAVNDIAAGLLDKLTAYDATLTADPEPAPKAAKKAAPAPAPDAPAA